MSNRITRIFQHHLTGTYTVNTVAALKECLYDAGLLDDPDDPLEAVLVDNVEHLLELSGQHGVPLARSLKPDTN